MAKKENDLWLDNADLPGWGRIYGGLVKLPDETILRVYIQMGEQDVELIEATIAVEVEEPSILNKKSLSFTGELLTPQELAKKIIVDGKEISIRQHICKTIIPYYRR